MLAATKRHPYRPAHVHFMIAKEGFEGLTTHIFSSESPYLDADTVFGVKESLIADLTHEEPGIAPDGSQVDEEWRKLVYRSEEHTSELQSLMRISYAVFCLKKKKS